MKKKNTISWLIFEWLQFEKAAHEFYLQSESNKLFCRKTLECQHFSNSHCNKDDQCSRSVSCYTIATISSTDLTFKILLFRVGWTYFDSFFRTVSAEAGNCWLHIDKQSYGRKSHFCYCVAVITFDSKAHLQVTSDIFSHLSEGQSTSNLSSSPIWSKSSESLHQCCAKLLHVQHLIAEAETDIIDSRYIGTDSLISRRHLAKLSIGLA